MGSGSRHWDNVPSARRRGRRCACRKQQRQRRRLCISCPRCLTFGKRTWCTTESVETRTTASNPLRPWRGHTTILPPSDAIVACLASHAVCSELAEEVNAAVKWTRVRGSRLRHGVILGGPLIASVASVRLITHLLASRVHTHAFLSSSSASLFSFSFSSSPPITSTSTISQHPQSTLTHIATHRGTLPHTHAPSVDAFATRPAHLVATGPRLGLSCRDR